MTKSETSQSMKASHALEGLRVGFLYNHDELHQVAHTAPIISSLQTICPALTVDVVASSDAQIAAVARHLDPQCVAPTIRKLRASKLHDFAERIIGRAAPLGRIGYLSANLDLLGEYDALVVPETTSTMLKTRFGLAHTKLIHFPHGAGDRSISISPQVAHFDLVLLPGAKTRDRMLQAGFIEESTSKVVGYPKFDTHCVPQDAPAFSNDRPTVFYNPHFDPKLSSWFTFGIPLLEYFAQQTRFNLIVAPHVMLFRRKVLASIEHRTIKIRKDVPDRFKQMEHIHIDEGSLNCVDMTYTNMADIYVGDVSSQVYEWIARPRPALFLNSHAHDWQGDPNYAFWQFGPVVDDFRDFKSALGKALDPKGPFVERQAKEFKETMDIRAHDRSSDRAARAIVDYLQEKFCAAPSLDGHRYA